MQSTFSSDHGYVHPHRQCHQPMAWRQCLMSFDSAGAFPDDLRHGINKL